MDKLDILNREEFVEQLVRFTENISGSEKSVSFSIDGTWGSGKSFVLDMFEEKLGQIHSEETATNKYLIIRYNCWKYDYYDEPLVAIVAALLESITEKTQLFDQEKQEKIKGILKAAGATLLSISSDAIKATTGFDFKSAFDILKSGMDAGTEEYLKMQEYDVYFGFKQTLHSLQELINDLGKQYEVVFLIDELDRCLPEYAIKVLERLHHLNEETENVISIIAIDKSQLKTSIEQIFGFEDAGAYLKKFIHFSVPLNLGVVSERITDKYAHYISLFNKDIFPINNSIEEFMQAIFKGIDVRTQEQLMNKAELAHTLLYDSEKDYTFMCMELLLTVMICHYGDESCFTGTPINRDFSKVFKIIPSNQQPEFAEFFGEKFKDIYLSQQHSFPDEPTPYLLPKNGSLYCAILLTWYWMHKKSPYYIVQYQIGTCYDNISNNHKELEKFAQTIKLIK